MSEMGECHCLKQYSDHVTMMATFDTFMNQLSKSHDSPMNLRLKRILKILVSLVTLSILVLPFASVFVVTDDGIEGHWKTLYLIEDWLSLVFYLPFVLLWCLYLIRTQILRSATFKTLLCSSAFITFSISFLSSIMIGQDYEPRYAVLSSLLIFPLIVVFMVIEHSLSKARPTVSKKGN
jgi:hypothetical protein